MLRTPGIETVRAPRKRQQRRDEGVRQRVRVIAVEEVSARQRAQRPAVFDAQAEHELAVQKQKRRHHHPVHDEGERVPERPFVLIREIRVDLLRVDAPVGRRKVVVQRVVIVDGLAAHTGAPAMAAASKSIRSI